MNCKEVTEKLLAYRDGDLPPDEIDYLRRHLHACPPCLHLFDGCEEVIGLLERLRPVNLPPDFLDRMKSKFRP